MKNPISLKLLYFLSKVAYWGIIVLIAIVTFAGIVMLTLDPELMKLGFPTNLLHTEEVVYLNTDSGVPVEVEFQADTIDIPVKYLNRGTMVYVLLSVLLWLTCLIVIARYIKAFLKRILEHKIFHSESIQLLKRTAMALVILEVIELLSTVIGFYYIQQNFDLGDHAFNFSWSFPSITLILALTFWTLAHIFQKGKALEEEQKLTI